MSTKPFSCSPEEVATRCRFDNRLSTEGRIRPHFGKKRVRDITPEMILAWQRKLTREGGTKQKKGEDGKPLPGRGLSANTVRLARSPLAGAFKLAMNAGIIAATPVAQVPRHRPARSIPKHRSPEQETERPPRRRKATHPTFLMASHLEKQRGDQRAVGHHQAAKNASHL